MPFWSEYGTLNSRSDEIYGENSPLWWLEYIFLKDLAGENVDSDVVSMFNFVESHLRLKSGLYDNQPFRNGDHNDETSHDQILAIMALSYRFNLGIHSQIWQEIKRQTFRYDNINPEKPSWKRILHPRDWIVFGMMSGSKLWYLLAPLLFIISMVSCMKKQGITSGKLLVFTRVCAIRNDFVRNKLLGFFDWVIPGGYRGAFEIYFGYPGHPMRRLFEKVFPND